jgi:hypothetical protein
MRAGINNHLSGSAAHGDVKHEQHGDVKYEQDDKIHLVLSS